jgi:general secretion pathway protein H
MPQTSRAWSTEAHLAYSHDRPTRRPPATSLALTRRERFNSSGFTLIEMVAVMLIIAMVAGLAVSFTAGTGRPQLEALALDAAALFRRERTSAILTGHSRVVLLDAGTRTLAGDGGDAVRLPRDVAIDVLGEDGVLAGEREVVRFVPDGSASGAVMRLSREGAGYEIRVNWFTGGVSVEKHDAEK